MRLHGTTFSMALAIGLEKTWIPKQVIIKIENVINLLFGYNQRMSPGQRIDVKKGIIIIILRNFMGGNFSVNYFAENGGP
jgi:hypothetical protein